MCYLSTARVWRCCWSGCLEVSRIASRISNSIETEDETVYFDARKEGNSWWASPVQVYLELMAGDKRDQETAEQVKSFILTNLQPVQK